MEKLKRERLSLNKTDINFINKVLSNSNKIYAEKILEISKKINRSPRSVRYLLEDKLKLHNTKKTQKEINRGSKTLNSSDIDFITRILKNKKSYGSQIDKIAEYLKISKRKTRYLIEVKYKLKKSSLNKQRINFSDLTDKDIDLIKKIYLNKDLPYDKRIFMIIDKVGGSHRSIGRWINTLNLTQSSVNNEVSEDLEKAKLKKIDKNKKIFLITSAQNATKANEGLLKNMEAYEKFHNAQILIIPIRYHNPGLIICENDKKQNWWDEKIVKYLSLKRHNLNNNVSVLSDVKIQPTAQLPLNGFEGLCGQGSAILGHPRMHMKSLPVLGNVPKLLFTTGTITESNYTDSKIGKLGEFHHSYGFVIVEIEDDEIYYIRQVIAQKNGDFNDLYFSVKDGVVSRNTEVDCLIKGDIHYGNHDEEVFKQSFDELIPKLKPKQLILHDVFDGYSINHHEKDNWVLNYQKSINGKLTLKNEINNLLNWLNKIKELNPIIVFSNHDDFLNRFILDFNPHKMINPQNTLDCIEFSKILLENEAPNGLLAFLITKEFNGEIKCLGRNDSFILNNWELAVHGMDGINGSKGNISQYKKLNTHIITAHTHSPARIDGAIQVGTNSLLKLGYNNGMSSWVHCDVIIHSDKKAQHILYIGKNKEFTTFK